MAQLAVPRAPLHLTRRGIVGKQSAPMGMADQYVPFAQGQGGGTAFSAVSFRVPPPPFTCRHIERRQRLARILGECR